MRSLNNSVSVDDLRQVIDDVLIRLHPRITYQIGRVIWFDSHTMLAEIAAEGDKDLLALYLKRIEEKMPVEIESLAWGWREGEKVSNPVRHLKQDPLANIEPDSGLAKYAMSKLKIVFRYILMVSLTIALITLLVTKFYLTRALVVDLTYALVFGIWLISLSEIPLDIRRYVDRIECDHTNLVISYWVRKNPIVLDWREIWGLEFSYRECKLYSNKKTVRVLLHAGNVLIRKENLLKTMIRRSSLNFVETNFVKTVYKRSDAPDEKKR
jgi:hypothetical protein